MDRRACIDPEAALHLAFMLELAPPRLTLNHRPSAKTSLLTAL
jgi:hypothetical protein